MDRKNKLLAKGYNLETIADKVSYVLELDTSEIWKAGKSRNRVSARSLFCFWAAKDLGIGMTELSRRLNLSPSGVSQSVIRGEKIAETNGFRLLED
jgi:putative transposase